MGVAMDITFSGGVVDYFSNSPTESEKDCLIKFFHELQTHGLSGHWRKFKDGRIIIIRCDHSIEISTCPPNKSQGEITKVTRINV
ncbi:hypothetical protein DXX93_10375 [Thalassotalea euphylliae]|uniref:Uncharacterized protein n=1 Tax=Thalassotalea euphylliae TaxID=1655234 RepID=A0A3E0TQZ6_9GAMM|nr:hypothetical protein DXX93_10375 [Thalassotalea euphylliae]